MKSFAGLDIGTSFIKMVLIGEHGQTLHQSRLPVPTHHPVEDAAEQDPQVLLQTVCDLVSGMLPHVPDFPSFHGIGISSAMHGVMAVRGDQPLTPLLTWMDNRSKEWSGSFRHQEQAARIYALTGTPIHPMSPLCKIAWLRTRYPELQGPYIRWVSFAEWLCHEWYGTWKVSESIASATGLLDIHSGAWCEPALHAAGIGISQLSEPVPVTFSFSGMRERYKTLFRIRQDLITYAGGSDGALATIASGLETDTDAALTIGTSSALRRMSAGSGGFQARGLFCYRFAEGKWLSGGPSNHGAVLLQWWQQVQSGAGMSGLVELQSFVTEAMNSEPGARGLTCIPYFSGERAPIWEPAASGALLGLTLQHRSADIQRALLEGVLMNILLIKNLLESEGMEVKRVFASGGLATSEEVMRWLSNILDIPVCIREGADASALGAAFIAAKGSGEVKRWQDVRDWLPAAKEIRPEPSGALRYQAVRQRYLRVFEAYPMWWPRWAGV